MRNAAELVNKELQAQGKRIDASCRGENLLTRVSGTIQLRIRACSTSHLLFTWESYPLSESLGLDSLGKITYDVSITMDKIDKVMKQVQRLSSKPSLIGERVSGIK